MGTAKTLPQTKSRLVKRFHTLLGKAGINEDGKLALLTQYGVSTSLDMDDDKLKELCDRIESNINPDVEDLDKMRKRLIASIFAWRKAMGCATDMDEVKGIACNACGSEYFNAIPKERLQSLYYAFNNKTKDLNNVAEMTDDMVGYLTLMN